MDFLRFIFACILFLSLSNHVLPIPTSTENDFYKMLERYEVEIAKELSQQLQPVELKSYNIYSKKLWYQSLGIDLPLTIDIFDRMYVLRDKTILELSMKARSLNETSMLKKSADLRQGQERPVTFVRTIKWRATLYLLVCYDSGPCSLYTGTPDMQLRFRQKVKSVGRAMDASFFTQANRLYLVMADNFGQFSVPSMIYHWTDTYMDIVTKVETTGAVSVTTFNHKQSTIIVFAQSNAQIGSKVFEFRDTTAEAIQLLLTSKPLSVRHFEHEKFDYVLLINEDGPSEVFWFRPGKGNKLLKFPDLLSDQPFSAVKIVNVAIGTFAFAAYGTTLQLFTLFGMSDWVLVNVLNVKDGENIVDVGIQVDGETMNIVLVTKNALHHTYGVEVWRLHITENSHVDERLSEDAPMKCFADLIKLLKSRMPDVEKAQASWRTLYPANENQTIIEELKLPTVKLVSGTIGTVQIVTSKDIETPTKIRERLDDMEQEIDRLFMVSDKIPRRNVKNNFTHDVLVEGDAFLEELETDSIDVDTFNNVSVRLDNILSAKGDQNFTVPLKGRNISVHHLETESICGIPVEYWAVRNDKVKTALIGIQDGQMGIRNDTVYVISDISIENLRTKNLNDIYVDKFLSELFIIGRQQEIKGNITYQGEVNVLRLTAKTLNDVSAEEFMTKTTNQSFNDVIVKSINIGTLYTDFINDVPVNEAARISRPNVIKGKVRLASLRVTDELNVQTGNVILGHQPTQIYDNVVITGVVSMENVDFRSGSNLFLNDLKVNPETIFEKFWTKSSNQTMRDIVHFPAGITIDHLNAELINGLKEDDFLYTTAEEIPEKFRNLHLEDVYVNGSIFAEGENTNLYQIGEELVIYRPLHLSQLIISNLFTEVINDIEVNVIIDHDEPVKITGNTNVLTVRAKTVNVNNLNVDNFNENNVVDRLKSLLHLDDDFDVHSVETSKFVVRDLTVEMINGVNVSQLIQLSDVTEFDIEDIVIDGDFVVENDLETDQIGGLTPATFLKIFIEKDIIILPGQAIDTLATHDLSTELFNNLGIESFFRNVMLKSKNQTFRDQFSFDTINANSVNVKYINNQTTSKLVWTDTPITISGSVNFTDLFVGGNVITERLNDQNVAQLYNGLLTVPTTKIDDLRINGSVSWMVSRDSTDSLTYLLENAVTKNTDQHIRGKTTFDETVKIVTFTGEFEGIEAVRSIVTDTVIDNEGTITISGKKTFKGNLSVNSVTVLGDIGIETVNGHNIVKFNTSMARKYHAGIVEGPVTFRETVSIQKLLTNQSVIHGGPIMELALANKSLPNNVVFQDLYVQGDVYLKYIGDVDFDEFVKTRVTLNGTHEILAPVQFNGLVRVTDEAVVGNINRTKISDLVINLSPETQVITGAKTFIRNLIVNGSVDVPLINNINVSVEFQGGVANDKDVEIIGDLVFEETVTILNDTSVSRLVNNVNLSSLVKDANTRSNRLLTLIMENNAIITDTIYRAKGISESLPNIFFYLEIEQNLTLEVPSIDKVDVIRIGEVTLLNMYGERNGNVCGLPVDCTCTVQYIAKMSREGCKVLKLNDSKVAWNFYEPNGAFSIRVETNVTSNGVGCIRKGFRNEFTTISWKMAQRPNTDDLLWNTMYIPQKIEGFPKDVQFLMHNDEVYITMAIYFNVENNTHRTYSPVYKLNMNNKKLTLVENISTNGAWSIEIFQIGGEDVKHILIGCYATSAESLLYRFDETDPKFTFVRSFPTRSRFVKSLSQEKFHFVLLDDPTVKAVQIYEYNTKFDNFYPYQTLFHDSTVNGIERFYVGEYANSDAYIMVTTEGGQFYIYEYMFYGKFQLATKYWMDDVQVMVPFNHGSNRYVFSGTKLNSTISRIIQQGPS